MSFKDGRIGVGKDPIFPLDISGSCRIDGDLILGGRFSDSQGNAIQLGSGSGATSTPDQTKVTLPSWNGGTITTQGLGVFKGKQDSSNSSLYITGDTSLPSSATGANNTTLGFGTGTDITSGSHNVLIGKDSGANITTGNSNTVIGRSAGQELTTGSENVMIGVLAGHAYNSGKNILIGHYAGFALSNVNGYNIAIGYNAMQQCESYPTHNICMGHSAGLWGGGDNSIFIGREAGKGAAPVSSNSGDENIGIGHSALLKIQGGEHNICIGYEAGSQNTAGLHNVCIGRRSGANITNNYNTLIGGNSGQGMSTGYQNTVVGYEAYNVSGLPGSRSNNVLVGMQCGYRIHCDNNVGIGYRALFNKKANVCTAIGYNCMGDGSPDSDHVGYNTGVGCNVLRTVEGSSGTQGCYNTVMGHHAAYNLTTGYKNVIIGAHAANNNHHLNQSVVIGHSAGYNFTNSTANVVIGIQAGMSITTGSQNILLGYQAGHNITTGTYNCVMGYNAMWGGAGTYNVALGDNAMGAGAHTSKNNNVAIGYQALYMATHGNLVAVGHQAGLNNSSGQQNTFIGYLSGKSTTTSSNNTFVGYEAGMSNTSSQNTFVGQSSGRMTTSGFDNTAVGYYSLYKNTSGYGNNAMGYYCLYNNTTGDYNVAIGVGANQYNTTGSNNVAIGLNANQYLQTRSHNIAIGAYAMAGNSTSATGSHYALYINSHNGYYGNSSFINGYMKMDDNPYLRVNAQLRTSTNVSVGHTNSAITRLDIRESGGPRLRLENTSGAYANQNQAIEFCTHYATTGYIHQKGEHMRIGVTGGSSTIRFYTHNNSGYPAQDGNSQTQSFFNETYTSGNDKPRMVIHGDRIGIGGTNTTTVGGRHRLQIISDGNLQSGGAAGGLVFLSPTDSDMMYIRRNRLGEFCLQTYYSGGNQGEINIQPYGGYVGIRTESPSAPLDVEATVSADADKSGWWDGNDGAWYGNDDPPSGYHLQTNSNASFGDVDYNDGPCNYSLHLAGGIYMEGNSIILITSDERIKKEITNANSNDCLSTLRNIPIREYKYKDTRLRGSGKTLGFIAQEVDKEFSMAVTKKNGCIPNEYRRLYDITWTEIKDNSDNIVNYKLTINDLNETLDFQKYRFYVTDEANLKDLSSNELMKEIISLKDEPKSFLFEKKWENLFLWGKYVANFHTIDKHKLYTLNFSATQELDKKVIALENENAELKARLAKIEAFLGI